MLDTLRKLCTLPGPSGSEDAVREFIISEVKPFADEIVEDPMGNLLVTKKGAREPSKKLMFAAHMDEVGVIVTGITDDGYLKFDFVGGVDRRVTIGKKVYINNHTGVIGMKAIHLMEESERSQIPKLSAMYIDIGASSRAEAEKLVSLGDTGVFDPGFVEFGNGMIKARAIDDRVGCAVMLGLIKEPLPVDATFAFTVQEEVGCRGANTAAFSVRPEIAIILEGTTAADMPSQKGTDKVCAPGKGPVIPFMDGGTVYNRGLFDKLRGLAEANGIPWQTKTLISGGTDASAIQRVAGGARVAAISAAVRYIHSPACVACIEDTENILKLARLFMETL
ncbi:MAG: M42 family metallopeptidase [Oscillospiraceae bacterium]|nr:M42 family metallopeptidase [Oscillospiraceae bacterium]